MKRSSKGLTSGQMLECFVLLSTLGGECLEDMERLRRDEALPQMLGYAIPAPETARQWLDRFHDDEVMKGKAATGILSACGVWSAGRTRGSQPSCGTEPTYRT